MYFNLCIFNCVRQNCKVTNRTAKKESKENSGEPTLGKVCRYFYEAQNEVFFNLSKVIYEKVDCKQGRN